MAGQLVRRHNERGMTTAEYAVGTVATVSVVGVIIGMPSTAAFWATAMVGFVVTSPTNATIPSCCTRRLYAFSASVGSPFSS